MRMMMVAVLLGMSSGGAAVAQEGSPNTSADRPAQEAPEKKVCRRMQVTGTILAGKRTCHTKAEWAQIDSANQDAVEQARRARGAR
jgi:hypothetical protein